MTRRELIDRLLKMRVEIDSIVAHLREASAPPQPPKPEPAPAADYPTDESGQFVGVAMTSKYPGRCCVCGGEYAVGDQIVYDYDSRRAGHFGCGRSCLRCSFEGRFFSFEIFRIAAFETESDWVSRMQKARARMKKPIAKAGLALARMRSPCAAGFGAIRRPIHFL